MKSNIQKVPYSDKCQGTMDWWSWDEICDNCGKVIFEFGHFQNNSKPDDTEEDLCSNCLRLKYGKTKKNG